MVGSYGYHAAVRRGFSKVFRGEAEVGPNGGTEDRWAQAFAEDRGEGGEDFWPFRRVFGERAEECSEVRGDGLRQKRAGFFGQGSGETEDVAAVFVDILGVDGFAF